MEVDFSRRSRSPLFRGLRGLEAGEALHECLAVLIDGVLSQRILAGRRQERRLASIALDVHGLGVDFQL